MSNLPEYLMQQARDVPSAISDCYVNVIARESDRFWRKVVPDHQTGCYLWTGTINENGYGRFFFRGRVCRAHRASYIMYVGKIPDGYVVDHLCRNRSCVNPEHLEAITSGENTRRGLTGAHQRAKTHCPHGHEYTPENTFWQKATGYRYCRECLRKYWRRRDKRRRAK